MTRKIEMKNASYVRSEGADEELEKYGVDKIAKLKTKNRPRALNMDNDARRLS